MHNQDDKLFTITDVSEMFDTQPHVLRYWELEFPMFKPQTDQGGHRCYSTDAVKIVSRIKELLYERGLTIPQARKQLEVELQGLNNYD